MPTVTREEMICELREMGFMPLATASRKWMNAFCFCNGNKTLFVLVRARGVDLLETSLHWEDLINHNGLLSVSSSRTGDRFAELFYSDSQLPVHERVLEVASLFVENLTIDQSYFQKIGIGRQEWVAKYGEKRRRLNADGAGSLCGLYAELEVFEGEDVYLSDGVWLSSDGSLHDRGR